MSFRMNAIELLFFFGLSDHNWTSSMKYFNKKVCKNNITKLFFSEKPEPLAYFNFYQWSAH